MPIDPSILNEAGRVAYNDRLSIEEREQRLERLVKEKPELLGSVNGYMEMLSMLRMAQEADEVGSHRVGALSSNGPVHQLPTFKKWSKHDDALHRVEDCGALRDVEEALRRAYVLTGPEHSAKGRLRPSRVVEKELQKAGWTKKFVCAPPGLRARDSFDGWKEFPEAQLKVAVEVEWPWQRVMGDLLKFWRAERLGQIDIGIEVLRGPNAFYYVVDHVYALYEELIPDLRVVFCALDASDLREPYPVQDGVMI
jgi:hypothetical protein